MIAHHAVAKEPDLFIMGDADHVREQVERRLLGGTLSDLTDFSSGLTSALLLLVSSAEAELGAETIMAGGDNVLFRVRWNNYSRRTLDALGSIFHEKTGCTISFGVGEDIANAYVNLRRAKAAGGGAIVGDTRAQ